MSTIRNVSTNNGKRSKIEVAEVPPAPAPAATFSTAANAHYNTITISKSGGKRCRIEVPSQTATQQVRDEPPKRTMRSNNRRSRRSESESDADLPPIFSHRPTKQSHGATLATPPKRTMRSNNRRSRRSKSESNADLPPIFSHRPTKKSIGATLATPPMSSERSNNKRSRSESESEADNRATKKSREPVDTQDENNDDSVEKGEEEDDDDQELIGVTVIPDFMPLNNDTAAAAAKIQSLFRGYCVRTMKTKAQPRVEREEDEGKATAAAAAAALMQMKAAYPLTTLPEEEATDEDAAATITQALIRGFCKRAMNAKAESRVEFDAAAIDATAIVNEENESESFEFEFNGGVADDTSDDDDDDDNNADEPTTKEDDVSSISSATEEEENKGGVGGIAVEDQDKLGGEDASELAAPPRRKRSRTRLMAALRCELDGDYWTSATSRRVIVRG